MIIDYKILASGGIIALESSVKIHISRGWKPIGGMSVLEGQFYQAIIQEEDKGEDK